MSSDNSAESSPSVSFSDLGLPPELLHAITDLGFVTPTPIQAAAIPALLGGNDVVGIAQTGTGKTAAFGLPMLAGIDVEQAYPQALILAPTRELALQSATALESFSANLPGLKIVTIYGGAPFYPQKRELDRGVHVVVGTPGRVIDHLERGTLDLSGVTFAVFDEGDEMLRMGFAEDVDRILTELPEERQTAIFSATMPPEIRATVDKHLHDPQRIAVSRQSSTVEGVEQRYAIVPFRHKIGALARVLATSDADAALVFVRTKASCEEVGAALVERGIAASVISGDVPQDEREKVIERLRSGQVNVLVATDVAARGLDVDRIGLVVNFDIPRESEAYVHRIGRTGRAGAAGVAFSFVTPQETGRLHQIERLTKSPMVETAIPTPAEVSAHRIAGLLARVPARLENGRLHVAKNAVEEFLNGHGEDGTALAIGGDETSRAIALATALAALAVGDNGPTGHDDEKMDTELAHLADRSNRDDQRKRCDASRRSAYSDSPRRQSRGDDRHGENRRDDRGYSRGAGDTRERRPRGDVNRYWIGVGRRDNAKPGAIVGAIANEGGLRGQDIGHIEISESFSIVEISSELSRKTMQKLAGAKVAGRALRIRPDAAQVERPYRKNKKRY